MRALVIISILAAYAVWKMAANPGMFGQGEIVGHALPSTQPPSEFIDITTIVSAVVVLVFYWFKFNEWAGPGDAPPHFRPRPVRYFTTWIRYLGWSSAYALLMVSAFAVIINFPQLFYRVIASFAGASSGLKNDVAPLLTELLNGLSRIGNTDANAVYDPSKPADIAPYAAMIVTVVWAGMRPFADFERKIRYQWQQRAAIPAHAKGMIDTLDSATASFVAEKSAVQQVVSKAEGRIDSKDLEETGGNGSFWIRYARTEYVHHLLMQYSRKPVFSNLADRYTGEYSDLHARMEDLRKRVARRISDIRELLIEEDLRDAHVARPTLGESQQWLDEIDRDKPSRLRSRYFHDQRIELENEIESTWHDILQLVVCNVLAVGRTATHRRYLLEDFGLHQERLIPAQLRPEFVTKVVIVTLGTVLTCSFIYQQVNVVLPAHSGTAPVPEDMNTALWWAFIACCMHLIATIAGFSVQRSLDLRREHLQAGKRRQATRNDLLAEASWAAAFGTALNVLLFALLLWNAPESKGGFTKLVDTWWWALVPGVTSLFAALYTQQDRPDELLPVVRRLGSPFGRPSVGQRRRLQNRMLLIQGTATGLVAMFAVVVVHQQELLSGTQDLTWLELNARLVAYGVYAVITTTVLGYMLGAIFSEWVEVDRHAGSRERRTADRQYVRKASWIENGRAVSVHAINVSDKGVDLSSKARLTVGATGQLEIPPNAPKPARIARRCDQDAHRFFVAFSEEAA